MIGDILQPSHLLFVLVIALLVLGPKRLPEVGRSLGRGLRDFRSALNGDERDRDDELLAPAPAAPPVAASQPVASQAAAPESPPPAPEQAPQPAPEQAPQPAAEQAAEAEPQPAEHAS